MANILVATDLSPAARACYPHAATWADALDAQVVLVHVDEHIVGGFYSPADFDHYLATVKGERAKKLRQARNDLATLGATVSLDLRAAASPSRGIRSAVREHDAELVIMGRQGEHPILDRVLGSTTARLVDTLSVPALVVPTHGATSGVGGFSVTRRARYERVLCGSDLSQLSERVAQRSATIAKLFGARLAILHIVPRSNSASMAQPGTDLLPAAVMAGEQQRRAAEKAVADLQRQVGRGLEVEPIVRKGSQLRIIMETCGERSVDLIALGSSHGGIERIKLGTIALPVALRAPATVLVFPAAWLESSGALAA